MTGRPLLRAAVCAALAISAVGLVPTGASATTCAPTTQEEQYERTEVVVEGTFADGPADERGELYRPAAFDVARYVKGSGPMRLLVRAGADRHDGPRIPGELSPRAGDSYRLYGSSAPDGELETGVCSGSTRLSSTYVAACPSDVPEDGLRDVPQHDVQEAAVDCAVHRRLVRGVGDGLFAPDRATTRAQLASSLAAALEDTGVRLPADPADAFDDDDDSPHERAVDQLAALGVVRGTGPRRFSPHAPVDRAQTATALVRAQERSSGEELPHGGDRFPDDDGSPHERAIDKANDAGWMGIAGYDASTGAALFQPGRPLPRRQLGSVLVRWVDTRVR